jgi:hypothetical protein
MKFKSEVQLEALNNANSDTDKFLVSDSSTVKYRTGAEVLSDIGGQSALTNPITGTGTLNYVSKFTGTTSLGNSLIFDNGSAVGIGTTSVSNGFLNVYRSTSGTTVRFSNPSGYVDIGPYNSGGAHIYTDRPQFYMNQRLTLINGQLSSYSPNNLSFMLNSGASTAMTILNTNGNVGIGTTAPYSKFTTLGALSTSTSQISIVNSEGGHTILRTGISGISNAGFSLISADVAGTNQNTRLVVNAAGNVGIGTTSPTYKLHVIGEGYFSSNLSANNIYATQICNVSTCNNASLALTSSGARITRNIADSNTAFAVTQTNASSTGAIQTWNNSAGELMRVTQSGNVGIGTTSPGAKLDIINSSLSEMFRLSNTEANATTKYGVILGRHYTNAEENVTGMLITSTSSATGGTVSIGGGISAANAVNNVLFYTAANNTTLTGTERMRITPSGNVGINTTSPNQKLHVNGATQLGDINAATNFGTVALKVVEGTVSTGPTLGSGAVGAQAVLYSNGAFGMYTGVSGNGNTWMQSQRNDAGTSTYNILLNPLGGKVGIGTSNPVSKLDLGTSGALQVTQAGITEVYVEGTGVRLKNIYTGGGWARGVLTYENSTGTDYFQLGGYGSGQTFTYGYLGASYNNNALRWYPNNNVYVGGNLGIGTDSPNAILDVAGDALINGVTIGQGPAVGQQNTVLGKRALGSIVYASANIAIGDSCNTDNDATGLTTIGVELNADTNLDSLNQDCLAISQYNSNAYSNQVPHIYVPKPISIGGGATNIITFDVNHYAGAIVEYMIRLNDGGDYAVGTVYMGWKSNGTGNMIDVRQIEYSDMSGFVFSLGGSGQTLVLTNTSGNNAWIRITVRGMMTN